MVFEHASLKSTKHSVEIFRSEAHDLQGQLSIRTELGIMREHLSMSEVSHIWVACERDALSNEWHTSLMRRWRQRKSSGTCTMTSMWPSRRLSTRKPSDVMTPLFDFFDAMFPSIDDTSPIRTSRSTFLMATHERLDFGSNEK